MIQDILSEPLKFEWDRDNSDKNLVKHGVRDEEAEEVFLNQPLVFEDEKHSKVEKRYDCLGITNDSKKLFISFTLRNNKIRIISARLMNKKEGQNMAKIYKEIPKFKNENQERQFWATHDSTDYIDWSKAKRVIFPNLQLSKRPISLRITNSLLAKVKMIANKKDMPYQTLMKQYLLRGVEGERVG